MVETLLSASNILLFGRKVEDLLVIEPTVLQTTGAKKSVGAATNAAIADFTVPIASIDDVPLRKGMPILVKNNANAQNGIYRVNKDLILKGRKTPSAGKKINIRVIGGTANAGAYFSLENSGATSTLTPDADPRHSPFVDQRFGLASQIEQQLLTEEEPCFARIYAVSFEGSYYELNRPILFLVHGEGTPVSDISGGVYDKPNAARAPGDPSRTGIGSADFQFSDDIMVWSYDKADYTIRMDVETGMFEDVLLAAMLGGGPGGMEAAGMSARGMSARGMSARGMSARGMSARGMSARGGGGNGD